MSKREGGAPPREVSHPVRLLLTGRPGIGKTTVIRKTLRRLDGPTGGFLTEEVREGADGRGARRGFDVVALSGERTPLARVGAPGPRVGRYGVDVRGLEKVALGAVRRALQDPETVVVLDEVGKMEFLSPDFVALLDEVFTARNPVLGTILLSSHPIRERVCRHPGVRVLEVTRKNRDELPDRLARWLAEK